jgi:hypothetical protein
MSNLILANQGQVNKQTNTNVAVSAGEFGELLVSELQPRYYEYVYRKQVFSNQFASNALATTSTSAVDVLINPTGSGVNIVLLDAYTAITALTAVATGTAVNLGWFACAVTPSTIGTLQTPSPAFVGSSVKSQAICAPTATVLVAPAYQYTLASLYGDLAANDILGVSRDIAGLVVIPPGFGLGVYGVTGTPADVTVQISLTWAEVTP